MKRSDFRLVLDKIEIYDGRRFSPAQEDAWFEIDGTHTLADALAAVLTFYSKPFMRAAYPGDLKALILETEDVRLRRCGSIEVNEVEWLDAPPVAARTRLRRLIATGEWSPEDYRHYQRSGLKLDEFLAKRGEVVG